MLHLLLRVCRLAHSIVARKVKLGTLLGDRTREPRLEFHQMSARPTVCSARRVLESTIFAIPFCVCHQTVQRDFGWLRSVVRLQIANVCRKLLL